MSHTEHTITQVERLKRPRGYSAVYVDGELVLEAPTRIVAGLGLWTGRVMCVEELRRALRTGREEDALALALKALAACERTETELRRQLARREFPQPIVATVLDRLREKGLIDDHRYAREYVRTQGARRGLGPGALRARLVQLGVAPSPVDEALVEEMSEESQKALAEAAARKRLRQLRRLTAEEARSRVYAFLLRRGFDGEIAVEVLEGLKESE